jgi:hypothetical protein
MWEVDTSIHPREKQDMHTVIERQLEWYCGIDFIPTVTCYKGHNLILSNKSSNKWKCHTEVEKGGCPDENTSSDKSKWHCDTCDFNYCGQCYENKKALIDLQPLKCHPMSGQQCQACILLPKMHRRYLYYNEAKAQFKYHPHVLTFSWSNYAEELCHYCGCVSPRICMWVCNHCTTPPFKLCLSCDLNESPLYVNFSVWSPDDFDVDTTKSESVLYFIEAWFSNPTLLSRLPTPVVVYNRKRNDILKFIYKLLKAQNKLALLCCARLWCAITIAARHHPSEMRELTKHAADIEEIIERIFRCDSLDDKSKLFNLILQAQLSENISQMTQNNVEYLKSTQSLINSEFLGLCLATHFKSVFSHPQILNIFDNLIWGLMEPLDYHARYVYNMFAIHCMPY